MSAPWDTWKLPLLLPDAPASLSGLPSEPAFAVPAVLSPPPVYGSSVASGKTEDDVAAMVVKGLRQRPQATRSGNWESRHRRKSLSRDAYQPCERRRLWRGHLKELQ
jgi:hypothetical protein